MQVLEKILEEIKKKTIIVPTSKEHFDNPQDGKFVEEVVQIEDVEDGSWLEITKECLEEYFELLEVK